MAAQTYQMSLLRRSTRVRRWATRRMTFLRRSARWSAAIGAPRWRLS